MAADSDNQNENHDDPPPRVVPLAALEAERQKRQQFEAKLAEIEAERQKREAEAAAERGEYEKLYQEAAAKLEATTEKLSTLEQREAERVAAVEADNEAALKALPDDLRELVPTGLDPFATAQQIRRTQALADKLSQRPAGSRNRGGGENGPKPPPECIASALHHNRDPEKWFPIWLKTPAGRTWQAKQTQPPT